MAEVEAVSFRNPEGLLLHGTLHTPSGDAPRGRPAVVLMSPGVKMRVGPGRLYVPITDLLTARGHTVLRFDFFGLGDSEGELPEAMLVDVYGQTEVGRFAADAEAALRWLRARGHDRFIVGGLCGGAVTALYGAVRDPGVEALISIGMTVTIASDAVRPASQLTMADLEERRRGYLRRLTDPAAWWRLLTFQSEFGVILRSFLGRRARPAAGAGEAAAPALTPEQLANVNPLFPPAFFAFLERGGRALMLFGEKDRVFSEYQEKFVALHAGRLARHADQVTQHVVPGANHVMSRGDWQAEMLDVMGRWLETGRA